MFPLTFGPTQHISQCSFFLSSVRVILPPRHFSLPFFFSTSVPPHLFSPLISLGYWPCLSLLIQCSIGRSIERLSVKRGVETPTPPIPPIFLSSIPLLPPPQPPHVSPDDCRHTSSWEAGFLHPILESISPPLLSGSLFISIHLELGRGRTARRHNGLFKEDGDRRLFLGAKTENSPRK